MVKLIFVVGIETQVQQQTHHIDIVILDSDLKKTVPLAVIGLKGMATQDHMHSRIGLLKGLAIQSRHGLGR